MNDRDRVWIVQGRKWNNALSWFSGIQENENIKPWKKVIIFIGQYSSLTR